MVVVVKEQQQQHDDVDFYHHHFLGAACLRRAPQQLVVLHGASCRCLCCSAVVGAPFVGGLPSVFQRSLSLLVR